MEDKTNFCFTIMPFRGYFNDYYSKIYKITITEAGLMPLRADDIYIPGTIINDIWESIQQAKIIIADLTEQNANVFYELGLAHASSKPVILISEKIDDIPFDLRALRTIIYNKNVPDWGTILKDEVVRAIHETLKAPLKSILPTFLNVVKNENSFVSESEKILLELKNDIESLKKNQKYMPLGFDLTSKDLEILKSLSLGNTFSDIASNLNISPSSLEKQISFLKDQFQAKNTVELISLVTQLGFI